MRAHLEDPWAGAARGAVAPPKTGCAGLVFLFVVLSSCVPYWGLVYQAPPARGIVVDGRTGLAVEGAVVRFAGSAFTTRSGPDGRFELSSRSKRRLMLRLPASSFSHVPVEAVGVSGLIGFGWARQFRNETREPLTSPVVVILLEASGAYTPAAPTSLPAPCMLDAESTHAMRLAAHLDTLAARPAIQALAREDPDAFRVLATSLRERIQTAARACALDPEQRNALLDRVDRFEDALRRSDPEA